MLTSNDRRTRGSGIGIVLLLLLIGGAALGLNYVRNDRIDQQDPKSARPYASYQQADLELLAAGYRLELASAERRSGGGRIQARRLHHLDEQIQEFERVQAQARRARGKALDIAQIRRELAAVEAEQRLRTSFASIITAHLTRMFRL